MQIESQIGLSLQHSCILNEMPLLAALHLNISYALYAFNSAQGRPFCFRVKGNQFLQ